MSDRTSLRFGLILTLVVAGVPAVAGAKDFTQHFEAKALAQVEVELREATVRVRTHALPQVLLQSNAGELHAELRGDQLHIDDKRVPEGQHVSLELHLPASLRLKVVLVDGDIDLEGLSARAELIPIDGDVQVRRCGELKIKAISGQVDIAETTGSVKVTVVSGDVNVRRVKGDTLSIKSVSGRIRAEDIDVAEVDLRALSGDLLVSGRLRAGAELELEAFSGDVELRLPGDLALDLDARTGSGEIQVRRPMTFHEQGAQRVRATAGSGGVEVRIKSYSGDILVGSVL